MAQQQQTVLRVQTNKISSEYTLPLGNLSVNTGTTMTITGSGTTENPYVGTVVSYNNVAEFDVNNNGGTITYMISGETYTEGYAWSAAYINLIRNDVTYLVRYNTVENSIIYGTFNVYPGDQIYIKAPGGSIPYIYFTPNESTGNIYDVDDLDLYTDIPIKINKSFAELQDISKRNSDYSIGLQLPGSKKNNSFFESYFNVDVDTLYFNPLLRVPATVLINDEVYFDGYLRLNKVGVQNSKVEYDVTLFSNIGDLFGKIGNNLLKDLPFYEPTMLFNHTFRSGTIFASWYNSDNYEGNPPTYMYPITHNGYNYSGDTVLLSGGTATDQTRLYTTSGPIDNYPTFSAMYAAGVKPYRSNTPATGLLDNQLKPALNVWSIIQLMFQTYGYTIKSDFMNTPWMKNLFMYGYFNSDATKFSYKTGPSDLATFPASQVEIKDAGNTTGGTITSTTVCGDELPYLVRRRKIVLVNKSTGIPCLCDEDVSFTVNYSLTPGGGTSCTTQWQHIEKKIPVGSSYVEYDYVYQNAYECPDGCPDYIWGTYSYVSTTGNTVGISSLPLAFQPLPPNTTVTIVDGDYVNFNLIINEQLKQIDFLSSIAKKFNLVFIPDPDVQNQIIIEPYQYYIGTGQIFDWTDKLSYDKGFTVQPALNFVESELILTDQDDGDDGNKQFKDKNNRIYGQNYVFNQTDFKSQSKKIDTIFSPQVMRKWDDNVCVPLGINYVSANSPETSGGTEKVKWTYKGVKTKPKLFYYLGTKNAFFNTVDEVYDSTYYYNTYTIKIMYSNGISESGGQELPVISNTMPLGNPDNNKINNDSICILFNSEQPTDVGVETFNGINSYTEQDMYNLFYENRINNLYNPNTRFLSGYFWLKQSDIKNLTPRDIIKIKEQYFTWNKISGFNMTNPELTQVELIQVDNNPSVYPTRYFQYYYCADPATLYNIKTDFTNPQMNLTHFFISNGYDYNVGLLGGYVNGFVSSFKMDFGKFLPYYIYEIDENTYNTTGNIYTNDPNIDWDSVSDTNYKLSSYWLTTGYTGINLWDSCESFTNTANTYDITVVAPSGGTPGSIYHSGITLNVTDTGWIKYDTATGTVYKQITSLGSYDIPDCADCSTVREGIPFADLAVFTITDCGTSCP